MVSLEFKDGLVNNRFSYYNDYHYEVLEPLNLFYTKEETEVPFILSGNTPLRTLHSITPEVSELFFSNFDRQLNGRVLTTVKIKEVIDGSRCPLKFRIGAKHYLIGKGFLAEFITKENIQVLFIATIGAGKTPAGMQDIKYYVSREIYRDGHKKVFPVIKDFMSLHTGEILITSNIEKYLGHKIYIPVFKTLSEKKAYSNKLVDFCLNKLAGKITKKEMPVVVEAPAKVKKKREAAILEEVRGAITPVEVQMATVTTAGVVPAYASEIAEIFDRLRSSTSVTVGETTIVDSIPPGDPGNF